MNIHIRPETLSKLEELQQIIVDHEGMPIGKSKLFRILVDIAYERLVKGEVDESK